MNTESAASRETSAELPPRTILLNLPLETEHALDLGELVSFVRGRLILVAAVTVVFGALAAAYAFLKTPEYEGTTILSPVSDDPTPMSLGGLGGLASLAGIQLNGAAGKAERVALLTSRGLVEDFIRDKGLLQKIFEKDWDAGTNTWKGPSSRFTLQRAYKIFDQEILRVDEDRRTGLVTLTVRWTDPQAAADWANELVARANGVAREMAINEATQTIEYLYKELEATPVVELRQGIYDLVEAHINRITVAKARNDYAFRVVDRARPSDPDQHVWPRRGLIIAGGLVGSALFTLMGVVLVGVLRQGFSQVESKPSQG